jgi:hypothetical protein
VVGGNAISVVGDSSSEGSATTGGEAAGSDAGPATTGGTDGIAGGSQVVGDADAPVTASGNAISVVGDSSSSGSTAAARTAEGSSDASTSGEEGTLGGTQVVTPIEAPVTFGGNAVSVIGDSTTTGSTGGDPGDVGGETTTPGGQAAALGDVTLLAATGSALLVPGIAFALLLMAAGAVAVVRARTA